MTDEDFVPNHAVRSYVLTGGRARPTRNSISVHTLLLAVESAPPLPATAGRPERGLLRLCRGLLSVAEAAAYLKLPVNVVKVLASDLVDSGHLQARARTTVPDRAVVERVLRGLQAL